MFWDNFFKIVGEIATLLFVFYIAIKVYNYLVIKNNYKKVKDDDKDIDI